MTSISYNSSVPLSPDKPQAFISALSAFHIFWFVSVITGMAPFYLSEVRIGQIVIDRELKRNFLFGGRFYGHYRGIRVLSLRVEHLVCVSIGEADDDIASRKDLSEFGGYQ